MNNLPITQIYSKEIVVVQGSSTYDPSQPLKKWIRPLQLGEDPTDFYEYQYVALENSTVPSVKWHTNGMTKEQASVANVPPSDFSETHPGVQQAPGASPIPMDPSLIPAGYSVVGTPFGAMLQPKDATASGSETVEQEILDEVHVIEDKEGIPHQH